ncbi:protein O-mannosyltransferase 1-like [Teleopsis dalmanni]|uniref:protein O-mannosyltransferase 1-like n=1 Tax=Teleopsis dalmanni TaxID=139649 RepID=UPI0018CEE34C|nr:protein O-mannosyltransferase 1-like [Teleopsis dalmanni]
MSFQRVRKRPLKRTSEYETDMGKSALTTTTSYTTTTTNSHTAPNDRLQRSILSDKLDALRVQQQQRQHEQILATALLATTCCRDKNCFLNATSTKDFNAIRESLTPSPSTKCSHRSSSCLSQNSVSSNASNNSTSSGRSSLPSTPLLNSTPMSKSIREISTDSGVDSENTYKRTIHQSERFTISINLDLISWALFFFAFLTRFYKLSTPANVVFDELHYGKYISLYIRNIFFFDQHPPLGKQLIAAVAGLTSYDGNFTFTRIGSEYTTNVPIFWLRFVPAMCGSLLAPAIYKLLLESQLSRVTALLGGLLIVLDNALLTQSRFILMESILLLFTVLGLYFLLKFQRSRFGGPRWLIFGFTSASFFACSASVKYVGVLSGILAAYLMCCYLWNLLYDATITNVQLILQTLSRIVLFVFVPICIYIFIFYIHLHTLHKAGPHDSVMTSAFQASLDGGLASITRGQPLKVVHGSQITLRHTHGRTCWLHSHAHVYPVRYPDKRGSSHQQQVTCYSFKDVNNWWIVKRPEKEDLLVDSSPDEIRHGDVIQLVHGITSRALNSHDVAAPLTPICQEVSCYIDYEINMKGELLWRVEILNRETILTKFFSYNKYTKISFPTDIKKL